MRVEVTSQKPSSGGRRQVIWPGVFENLNGRLSFSEGETQIFRGPLDPVDQRGG
jgi:hypothetical protein